MKITKKTIYLLSFLLPLGVMIGCMVYFEVQPFGDNSLLIIDGLHQYMPFFSILYDKLKGGESLFYTFRAGLGINFLSLFSYYLSSPLNLFILFFDKTQLNMAVSILVVLKIAISGLTAGIYFTSKTKKPGIIVLLAALAYAVNSYMVGYCWNVMWLDAIMIFPIIMMGIERLIEKRDGRLYCLALFYALYCNYYIAFMICIFAVIWYLFYSFKSFRQFFFRGIVFALYSFLAAGMAAVLLIPAYRGIKLTESGTTMFLPSHSWLGSFADLLTRQFDMAGPISHDNFDGTANLYIGIFTVFTAILYFLNREIHWFDKLKKAVLLIFFYISFNEEILNFIWHGFHNQYGIPNRFSFLYGFVLLTMMVEVFEHKDTIRNWQAVLGCCVGVGLLLLSRNYAETPLDDSIYGVAGMLFFLYALLLFVASFGQRFRQWHILLFGVAAMIEMGATAVLGFDANGQISVSKFFSGTEDMEAAVESLSDGTFYRSELADAKMVDENAWYRLNAIGLFGSTANDNMVNIMDSLGFYTGCNEYLYKGGNPVSNLLLGVKYLYYHPEDSLNTDFAYYGSYGDFDVYKNQTEGLSIGYMMDSSIDGWFYESAYPFRVLDDLCYQGYGYSEIFSDIAIPDPITNGCTATRTNDGEYYFEFENAQTDNMVFTIPIEEDRENVYLFYDGTQVENAQIAINGQIVMEGDLDGYILPIGSVEAGDLLTVSFQLKGETSTGYVRLSGAEFDEELFEEMAQEMTSQAFQITSMSDNKITGTVTASDAQMLFFSIPYDAGWQVKVDGTVAEAESIGDAFLAVSLEPGTHTISLRFIPDGFSEGWKLSILSIAIFICVCAGAPYYRKKRDKWDAIRAEKRRKKMESAGTDITSHGNNASSYEEWEKEQNKKWEPNHYLQREIEGAGRNPELENKIRERRKTAGRRMENDVSEEAKPTDEK